MLPAISESSASRAALPADVGGVLGVGVAVLDLIQEVTSYPGEDEEVRAIAQRRVRGGNVTNSLTILAQFGHSCSWIGTLGDDAAAAEIRMELVRQGIDVSQVVQIAGGTSPLSSILLSRATGSRTIVHYRDLPELDAAAFAEVSLEGLAWVHFEGRNPVETEQMIRRVRSVAPDVTISLELEKNRPDIDILFDGPHVLLAGQAFARARGWQTPTVLLEELAGRSRADLCVVAWGEQGAALQRREGPIQQVPAVVPPRVVDTLGAGDVFNAGVMDGLLRGLPALDAVRHAVRIAGAKCGRMGLDLRDLA